MSAKDRDEAAARERDVDAAIVKLDEWLLGRRELDNQEGVVAAVRLQLEEIRLLRELNGKLDLLLARTP